MRGKDFNTGLRGVLFEARHYQRMGAAVWLYGWLVLRQTHQQGSLGFVLGGAPITYREIEEETGFNPRTLERWMQVLRRQGYIHTETVPAGIVIYIAKAKKFPQGSRNPADPVRKSAGSGTQNSGGKPSYHQHNLWLASEIRSSSIDSLQERKDIPFLHRDFHSRGVSVENKEDALNQNPFCVADNQNRENRTQRQAGPELDATGKTKLEQGTVLDARLLRQLLRREREEAVRRELAVGTGPEVRRP